MIKWFKDIFIGSRFLAASAIIVFLFAVSYSLPWLFPIAQGFLIIFGLLIFSEFWMLFNGGIDVKAVRTLPEMFSLGDENPIDIVVSNQSDMALDIELIDELPYQFQERNLTETLTLASGESETKTLKLRPTVRGEYQFGHTLLYIETYLKLFKRRVTIENATTIKVYPSIMQMKSFELIAFSRTAHLSGVKKLRRMGSSYEFEKIKSYVQGDDIRHINWKATSKRDQLMVNLFETERSQPIYTLICKSREMMMPFNGMSLLDYSINTALAISNIALHKYDKMGLITFSDKIGTTLKASGNKLQLKKIVRALYNEKERDTEANYELLYRSLSMIAKTRALLFLFINFESMYALERALPILRRINKRHLLVIVFFRNTEIEEYEKKVPLDIRGIYQQTIAKKLNNEKMAILSKLRQANHQ